MSHVRITYRFIKFIKAKSLSFILSVMLLCLLLFLLSCLKTDDISNIPTITFKEIRKIPSSNGIDSKAILAFEFTDGDGDIGLTNDMTYPPYDTSSVYYYNIFIKYFEKQNGEFKEVQLPIPFHARIPYVTPKGQNKALKGVIEIEVFINNPFSVYDTIQFQIYIVDRALHHSNTIITPEIKVKKTL